MEEHIEQLASTQTLLKLSHVYDYLSNFFLAFVLLSSSVLFTGAAFAHTCQEGPANKSNLGGPAHIDDQNDFGLVSNGMRLSYKPAERPCQD